MCAEFGIAIKDTPTESHNSLSLCERYHQMIRRVFRKVKGTYPNLDDDLIMSIAVHAVNCTAGPDGITPVLLLFGDTQSCQLQNLI